MATSIVTGGAGFLGSHLVDALVKRGESVIVLDDLKTGRLGNLESAIASGRVTFVYAGAGIDIASLRSIISKSGATRIRAVFHMVPPSRSMSYDDPLPLERTVANYDATSLRKIALENDAPFIISSVAEVVSLEVGENSPADNRGSSDQIDANIAELVRESTLDARMLRVFNCYGPRMQSADGSLLFAIFDAAVNRRSLAVERSGHEMRFFTYVDDVTELLLKVSERRDAPPGSLDVANEHAISLDEIAEALSDVVEVTFAAELSALPMSENGGRVPDLSRTNELGWRAKTSLQRGLHSTYDWFLRDSHVFV